MKKSVLIIALLLGSLTISHAQYFPETTGWKWDTVICYDEQNAVMERLSQAFDGNGYALSQLIEEKSGSAWDNVSRVIFTNDPGGKLSLAVTDLWQAGNWVPSNRVSVTYNVAGLIAEESVERNQGGLWGAYVRRSYTYDASGRKTTMIQERWSGGDWHNDLRTTYTYFPDNQTVLMEYSDDGNLWQVGGRFVFTCDQNGYYTELLMESFEGNQWESSFKIDYTTDTEGNILSEWAYAPFGSGWVSDSRKTYTHDINGNVITGVNERWDAGTWLPDLQSSYLYNKQEYMLLLNVPVYRYEASYRWFPLGTDEKHLPSFRMYPNPATDFVTIEFTNHQSDVPVVAISDHLGKALKVPQTGQNRTKLGLRDLPSGLYLISVKTKEGSATRKLVIQ